MLVTVLVSEMVDVLVTVDWVSVDVVDELVTVKVLVTLERVEVLVSLERVEVTVLERVDVTVLVTVLISVVAVVVITPPAPPDAVVVDAVLVVVGHANTVTGQTGLGPAEQSFASLLTNNINQTGTLGGHGSGAAGNLIKALPHTSTLTSTLTLNSKKNQVYDAITMGKGPRIPGSKPLLGKSVSEAGVKVRRTSVSIIVQQKGG